MIEQAQNHLSEKHNFGYTCLNGLSGSHFGIKKLLLDTNRETKDIQVLQLLTRLVKETDRLVRLADDIDTNATSPQAKAAFNIIGSEVDGILGTLSEALGPLYRLYDLDPGMRQLVENRKMSEKPSLTAAIQPAGTDES